MARGAPRYAAAGAVVVRAVGGTHSHTVSSADTRVPLRLTFSPGEPRGDKSSGAPSSEARATDSEGQTVAVDGVGDVFRQWGPL